MMNIGTMIIIVVSSWIVSFCICCMLLVADIEFDFQNTLKWGFVSLTLAYTIAVLWAENEIRKYEELD